MSFVAIPESGVNRMILSSTLFRVYSEIAVAGFFADV